MKFCFVGSCQFVIVVSSIIRWLCKKKTQTSVKYIYTHLLFVWLIENKLYSINMTNLFYSYQGTHGIKVRLIWVDTTFALQIGHFLRDLMLLLTHSRQNMCPHLSETAGESIRLSMQMGQLISLPFNFWLEPFWSDFTWISISIPSCIGPFESLIKSVHFISFKVNVDEFRFIVPLP